MSGVIMSKKKKDKTDPNVDVIAETNESGETSTPAEPTDPFEALQAERDDLLARLQRTAADYANYQKLVQREIT